MDPATEIKEKCAEEHCAKYKARLDECNERVSQKFFLIFKIRFVRTEAYEVETLFFKWLKWSKDNNLLCLVRRRLIAPVQLVPGTLKFIP